MPIPTGTAFAACLAGSVVATGLAAEANEAVRTLVIRGHDGDVLARLPLDAGSFAVSYRNSLYGTVAEERYAVLPDGRYRLVEIAADQLAVLEEYYSLPDAPRPAAASDRRRWVARPDPERPVVVGELSIAATDLGQRTVHVAGEAPVELWRLVEDENPVVVLHIEEAP